MLRTLKLLVVAAVAASWMAFASSGHADSAASGLIAFDTSEGGPSSVYVVRPDGSGLRKLARPRAFLPRVSSDGRLVAYASDATGNAEIYVVHPDGTGRGADTPTPDHSRALW